MSQLDHIADYENFRWATTEPLPAPFTINERFLFPTALYDWDTNKWVDPATKMANLDKPKPESALVQDKVIAEATAPQAAASSSKAAAAAAGK